MLKAVGTIRHDVTFQCPACGYIDMLEMDDVPMDGIVECVDCAEEIVIEFPENYSPKDILDRWVD